MNINKVTFAIALIALTIILGVATAHAKMNTPVRQMYNQWAVLNSAHGVIDMKVKILPQNALAIPKMNQPKTVFETNQSKSFLTKEKVLAVGKVPNYGGLNPFRQKK